MSDYISREAAVKAIYEYFPEFRTKAMAAGVLLDIFSADVAKVRHGEWIHREDFDYIDNKNVEHWHGMCSQCGFIHDFLDRHTGQYNYCPNCGAKMDKLEG